MDFNRNYTVVDLFRFKRFAEENQGLKISDLIKGYNEKYPELTHKEKLANIYKAMGMNNRYKQLMGYDIPESEKWDKRE